MKKYLRFHIKDSLPQIILFIVITLISCFSLSIDGYIHHNHYYNYDSPTNNPLTMIAVIGIVLSVGVPIIEFSYRMRKITIDQMYSFPIKREKIFLAHYITGYIKILIPVTVAVIYFLIDLSVKEHLFDVFYIIPFYFSLLGTLLIGYSFVTFIFMRGNTVGDGLINMLFGIFFIPAIIALITFHQPYSYPTNAMNSLNIDFGDGFIFKPVIDIIEYFQGEMEWYALSQIKQANEYLELPHFSANSFGWLIFHAIFGIASFVLSIILVKKDKSENSMGISNSWFSYKIMIPVYLFVISYTAINAEFIAWLFILIGGFLMYVIYRRTLKIKIIDVIIIVSCVLGGLVISSIIESLIPQRDPMYPAINTVFIQLLRWWI